MREVGDCVDALTHCAYRTQTDTSFNHLVLIVCGCTLGQVFWHVESRYTNPVIGHPEIDVEAVW
jgi:hypothetical protein